MGNRNTAPEEEANPLVDKNRMDQIFRFLDNNLSGFIEEEELEQWLSREPLFETVDAHKKAAQFMKDIDADKDGKIGPEDFRDYFSQFPLTQFNKYFSSLKAVELKRLLELFKLLDLDEDGYLNFEEFSDWINNEVGLKEIDAKQLFNEIDITHNERISPEELVSYYTKFSESQIRAITANLYKRHSTRLAKIRDLEAKADAPIEPPIEVEQPLRTGSPPHERPDKAIQRETIQKLFDSSRDLKEGDVWYVVSMKWWEAWKEFVGYEKEPNSSPPPQTEEPPADAAPEELPAPRMERALSFKLGDDPGFISNSDLSGEHKGQILFNLSESQDFVVVPAPVWDQLFDWYGGGPVFARHVITVGKAKECQVDLWPYFIVSVWADSVTGKPDHSSVSRETFPRNATLRQVLDIMVFQKQKKAGLKKLPQGRLWFKKDDQWILVNDDILDKSLPELQFQSGDTIMLETLNDLGKWPREIEEAPKNGKANWRDFEIGDEIDALDTVQKWYQSIVRDVKPDKIFIHFHGWASQYDEWFPKNSPRLAPLGTHTKGRHVSKSAHNAQAWARSGHSDGKPAAAGTVGLTNLGNTCFMNSTLQCLLATKPLCEFFLSGTYSKQINANNPLGHMGRVAEEFGNLVKLAWSNKYSAIAPAQFKHTIGEFAPQFSGFQQHDSSELLSFLLDGLHEDLNRIQKKPYTQDVEGSGRPDHVVAQESWETYLKRNDSIITDILTGQLKNKIVCPEAKCGRISIKFDPFVFLSVPIPIPTHRTLIVTLIPADWPAKPMVVYGVKVPKSARFGEVKNELSKLSGIPPEQINLGEMSHKRVARTFGDDNFVEALRERDNIYAWQVAGKQPVKVSQDSVSADWREHIKVGDIVDAMDDQKKWYESLVLEKTEEKIKVHYSSWSSKFDEFIPIESDRLAPRNAHSTPIVFYFSCSHSQQIKNPHYNPQFASVSNEFLVERFGVPFFFSFQAFTLTKHEIHEQMKKMLAPVVLDHDSTPYQIIVANTKYAKMEPFPLPDNDEPADFPMQSEFLISWKDKSAYDQTKIDQIERHSSAPMPSSGETVPGCKTLLDCLDSFTSEEILSKEDAWYCSSCSEFRQASKKFDLWSPPEILILHLKRFSFTRRWREKLRQFIDFPIEGLDMSNYIVGPTNGTPLYDLYAVSNHMGDLGGGHYTAYVKNPKSEKWFLCDDSHVSAVDPEQVKTANAYVLFYQLRK